MQSTQSEDINFSLLLLTKDHLREYTNHWPKDKQICYCKLRKLFINFSTIFTQPSTFTQMLNDLLPTDLQVFWQLVFQQVFNSTETTETTYNELIDAFISSCTRYEPFCKPLWFELGEKIKKETDRSLIRGIDIINALQGDPKKRAQLIIGTNTNTVFTAPDSEWSFSMKKAFNQLKSKK